MAVANAKRLSNYHLKTVDCRNLEKNERSEEYWRATGEVNGDWQPAKLSREEQAGSELRQLMD